MIPLYKEQNQFANVKPFPDQYTDSYSSDHSNLTFPIDLCTVNKDQRSCPGENIRVSDTVSDPNVQELWYFHSFILQNE